MNKEYQDMIWRDGKYYKYNDKFVDFLKNNITNENSTPSAISKLLQIDYKTIKNIIEENNISLNKNKNDCKFKAMYQDYDWCYQRYMIEGMNHEEMAKEAGISKRTIEKWCTEKHRLTQKYRQINKKLSSIQRDLIIGSMIGDGHIDRRETQPMFIVSHAENQKDYLFWKYNILKDLCNIKPTYYEQKEAKHFKTGDCICQPYYRIHTRIHDCLKEIRSMSVKELLDELNEFSFSVAMLDDGYRGNLWSYCIAPYTPNEAEYILDVFKSKFDISGYIRESDKRYICFNAIDSVKIDTIILDNIPNNLDIIQYKIIQNDKINQLCNYRMISMNEGNDVGLSKFCKLNHISFKYDYPILCKLYDSGITNINDLMNSYKEVKHG